MPPNPDALDRLLREATARPWRADGTLDGDYLENVSLASISGCGCCGSPAIKPGDARLITTAVNHFASAVELVRDVAIKECRWIDCQGLACGTCEPCRARAWLDTVNKEAGDVT